ncbi:MAG: 2-oxoacid:acceptor oxidoreductase family protein [Acidimicrobiales bacterium]
MSRPFALVVAGVGGQGVIGLAQLLGRAALDAGIDARVGRIHGLSQRGGSVEATLVLGPGRTAFVGPRQADLMVGLEPLEAERALPALSPDATAIVNRAAVVPIGLTQRGETYPSIASIVARIDEAVGRVHLVDGTDLARRAGGTRLLSTVLAGGLAAGDLLPFPGDHIAATLERSFPDGRAEATMRAFTLGRESGVVACR